MTRVDRKLRERHLLNTFLHKLSISGSAQDSESPDFLVVMQDRTVGIEITELHHMHSEGQVPLQARESVAARVVAEAERLFLASHDCSLRVSVNLAPNIDPRSLERQAVARHLSAVVSQIMPVPGRTAEWRPGLEDYMEGVPTVAYVHVYRQPDHFASHWFAADAGWVASITLELLQAAVDAKADRLPGYRKRASEVWLVLAILGRTPSQFFQTSLSFDPREVRSPFDRTYLHEAFLGHAILLGSSR